MLRRCLPWFGLFLLVFSFLYFLRMTPPARRLAQPHRPTPTGEEPLVIVLDPGHGGDDSGAMCGAIMEKDLALDVAQRAEMLLREAGYKTVLTRDSDRYLSLAERAEVANAEKHSLFVSIHFNDGERAAASGVETYFAARQRTTAPGILGWLSFFQPAEPKPLLAQSESLARFLQTALVEHTRAVNRGTKSAEFYVIRNVRHPAALVEGGFITNPEDVTKLTTEKYRQEIAAAISDGIHRYRTLVAPNEPALALAAPVTE
ncbi:MAG: N-acetylmuramoyl-L-alanine amidase family protein [Chthoniobacterales bacterium]